MVAGCGINTRLLKKVAEIYAWLDMQIHENNKLTGQCNKCGKCCDFNAFEHRLFVTPPEIAYIAANLEVENLKPMPKSRCPYNINSKCTVYEYRFAGCRIFNCNADRDFQSNLSESVLLKLKKTCNEFKIPYIYTDLASALNSHIQI